MANKVISREYVEKNYIHKAVIIDKIKELKEEYEFLGDDNKRVNKFEIELLQELLEETNEQIL